METSIVNSVHQLVVLNSWKNLKDIVATKTMIWCEVHEVIRKLMLISFGSKVIAKVSFSKDEPMLSVFHKMSQRCQNISC